MNYHSKAYNENDPLQARVFARWISSQIKEISRDKVENITKDLSNGVALIELAEVLTHKKAPRSWDHSPNTGIKNAENCDLALEMFKADGVKLVGISGKDISDKNQKLIYGLIWSLILHYYIGNSVFSNDQNGINYKNNSKNEKVTNDKTRNETNLFELKENALLSWALNRINNYPNIQSFKPYELAVCALLDSFVPEKIHYSSINPQDKQNNLKLANDVMNQLGIQVFIYNDDISQNNNQIDRIALLTQLAAIKSAFDNKYINVTKKNLVEKESESEWDPETESQTEQISEAEAVLEQKEILEEARIKKEEEKAKRKAALEERRKCILERKLRKQLVLLKEKEEAKLRREVAISRQNEEKIKEEEEKIKAEEKRIKEEEQRIISEKERIKKEEQKVKEDIDRIKSEENEIRNAKFSNDNDNLITNNSQKSYLNEPRFELTKENENKEGSNNSENKKYTKIITKKHYKIKIAIRSKNIDLDKVKKLNLGIRVDENDKDNKNAATVNERGDAFISLPSEIANNEKITRNMKVIVKKDGKVLHVDHKPTIIKSNGEQHTYHVKLL